MYERDPWWREALCAEVGTDLFFVGAGDGAMDAKRVCRLCPVRTECLADALQTDIEHGVFGGFARPVRRPLALLVEQGQDAMTVATAAIERDRNRRPRSAWAKR